MSRDFFNVFTCPVIAGDPKRIFESEKNRIEQKLASKLFDKQNPVGQTISWVQDNFEGTYEVVAVFKSMPANATEQYDLLMNFDLFVTKRPGMLAWGNSDPHTYVLLKDNVNKARLDVRLRSISLPKTKNQNLNCFSGSSQMNIYTISILKEN